MSAGELRTLPPASEERQELRYLLGLVWRRRTVLLAAAIVGLVLGLGSALVQTPLYRAASMVRIDMPTPPFVSVSNAFAPGPNFWQYQDFYNTEFEVLGSQMLGAKAVKRLGLDTRPPFSGAREPGRVFMAHVRIEPLPQTRLVRIVVTHADPREAALWANTLAQVYLDESVAMRVESARQAYEWLQERLSSTQQSMQRAQERLLESYQKQDVLTPEVGGVSMLAATITKINEEIAQAQARRIEVQAVLAAAAELERRNQPLETLPQVSADTAVLAASAQLGERAAELRRLLEKYTPAHPEVQRVQASIADLEATRTARTRQILRGFEAEAVQLQVRERELRAGLSAQKAQATAQTRSASQTEALRKETESGKVLYEALLQKLNETDIASSLKASNVTIVDQASPPGWPASPDKRRAGLIGLVAGLVLGLLLVVGLDLWHDTIKSAEEIEHHLHMDVLAVVPRHVRDDDTMVTEAYQNLRTALIFSRSEEGGQVVLVTGTIPQEGKTTTALHLARLLAGAGETTVLVDCDLRRGQLHARLGLEREPGLTDVLAHQHDLATSLRAAGPTALSVLTSGPVPPNPPALLARKQMADLLADLKARFEWVIVDSPPLASVTDAQLLSRHADCSLFVVQHDRAGKALVRRTVSGLRRSGANVLGAVLNSVALHPTGYYGYYESDGHAGKPASFARRLGRPARRPGVATGTGAPASGDASRLSGGNA